MILVWSLRLGSFLFRRVKKHGGDGRFDKIKQDPMRFLMAWTVQALWVSFTAAAAWAAMSSGDKKSFGIVGALGLIVWIFGFGFEVIADQQKSKWRADPKNAGTFITGGLWDWSRHPNYFGEFMLWLGVAIMALPALQGWQHVTLLSPVFVFLLLTRVSGVPALELRSDKKWGGQDDYEDYKNRVPVFFPKPPS
jgi:steroid 5-alpha reductase family enzyme